MEIESGEARKEQRHMDSVKKYKEFTQSVNYRIRPHDITAKSQQRPFSGHTRLEMMDTFSNIGERLHHMDRHIDGVAEGLYRIQNRIDRGNNKRRDKIQRRQRTLSQKHETMSQRSLQLSELSYQEGETRLEKASRKAISIEKLNAKIQRKKKEFAENLSTKNLEKQ